MAEWVVFLLINKPLLLYIRILFIVHFKSSNNFIVLIKLQVPYIVHFLITNNFKNIRRIFSLLFVPIVVSTYVNLQV